LLWSFVICIAIFLIHERSQLIRGADALTSSSPRWLGVMIGVQVMALVVGAVTYQVVLRRLGHHLRLRSLAALHLRRKVVGTIAPVGGPASVYVLVRGLGRHGVSSEDALFATGLRSLSGYLAFVSLLLPIVLLSKPGGLALASGAVAIGVLAVIVAAVTVVMGNDSRHQRLTARAPQRLTNLLLRARSHEIRPRDLARPTALALAGHLTNIFTMYVAILAVGHTPSISSVLLAYTVGAVFMTLMPVFQGIGVVEVTTAVTLEQFGVPAGAAVAATLLYRGATVWLPLLMGLALELGQRVGIMSRLETSLSFVVRCTRGVSLNVSAPWSLAPPVRRLLGSPDQAIHIDDSVTRVRRRRTAAIAMFTGLLVSVTLPAFGTLVPYLDLATISASLADAFV
jgi:uncharacterized protein (TIRG00374 family)